MSQRRAGLISLKVGGIQLNAKGNFTYNLGGVKRDAILGADAVHGFKEAVQAPFIEGEITDHIDLDLAALINTTDETVTLQLGNGKVIVLRSGWWAAEGTGNSEEGNVGVRFEGLSAEEVR